MDSIGDSIRDTVSQAVIAMASSAASSSASPTASEATKENAVFWNTWTTLEADPPNDDLVDAFEPGVEYRFSINLAAYDYRTAPLRALIGASGLLATQTPTAVASLIHNSSRPIIPFEVVISPDPAYFDRDGSWEQPLPVSIAKLQQDPGPIDDNPLTAKKPKYEYGRVSFKLKAKDDVDAPVNASIAIFISVNGKPVDELEVWRCISNSGRASDCPAVDPVGREAGAAGVTVQAGLASDSLSDAQLHIVEISGNREGESRVSAVFRQRTDDIHKVVRWELPPLSQLRHSVVSTLLPFRQAQTNDQFSTLAKALLNILFPAGKDGRPAFDKFSAFVRRAAERAAQGKKRSSLTLRIVPNMAFPLPLAAIDDSKEPIFLGKSLSLQMPLDRAPLANPSGPCKLSWVALRPPAIVPIVDDDLKAARDELDRYALPLLERLRGSGNYFDLPTFGTFMASHDTDSRTALVVLSHHDGSQGQDHLLFDMSGVNGIITPSVFARAFERPSFAILDACGTGNPAALGFIDRLKDEGFASVVATATEVDDLMGADFLYCFADSLNHHTDVASLGQLFDESISCLSKIGNGKYGNRIYSFFLVGDASTPVCPLK